jgi:hypothetical protein
LAAYDIGAACLAGIMMLICLTMFFNAEERAKAKKQVEEKKSQSDLVKEQNQSPS